MSLVVPHCGERLLLERLLGITAAGHLVLCLYTNDVTPAEDDTLATYTELTADGYQHAELGTSWTISTSDGTTKATYAQQVFVVNAAATVYGYFVTDLAGTTLLWAERFKDSEGVDSPVTIPSVGGGVIVAPVLTAD